MIIHSYNEPRILSKGAYEKVVLEEMRRLASILTDLLVEVILAYLQSENDGIQDPQTEQPDPTV